MKILITFEMNLPEDEGDKVRTEARMTLPEFPGVPPENELVGVVYRELGKVCRVAEQALLSGAISGATVEYGVGSKEESG